MKAMLTEGMTVTIEEKYNKKNLTQWILWGGWTMLSRIGRTLGSNHQKVRMNGERCMYATME